MPIKNRIRILFLDRAFNEIDRRLRVSTRDLIKPVSERLAEGLRDGKSKWPVDTGLSRDSFGGDKRGITNAQTYAKYVEFGNARYDYHKGKARDYVLANIETAAKDVMASLLRKPR